MTGDSPAVIDAVHRYLRVRYQRSEISKETVRTQRTILQVFARSCGQDRPVGSITKRTALRWWDAQACGPSTARTRLAVVRTFLSWCQAQGWLRSSPLAMVKPPKEPRRVPRTLPVADVAQLLERLPDARAVAMASMMVQCGLRCGEVAALRMEDMDQRQRTMVVHGKGGHQRYLPVPDEAWQALQHYWARYPPPGVGPVFRRYDQPHLPLGHHTISNMLSEWMTAAGVKQRRLDGVSAHALRRTMASDMLDGGANVRAVQLALGHAHLATTEHYLRRLDAADLRVAMGGRTYGGQSD